MKTTKSNPQFGSMEPKRKAKPRQSNAEFIKLFWEAPSEAFFVQKVVAAILCLSPKTLECDRWRGVGIPYRKIGGRVLYRKRDVIDWLESHALVCSISE